MNWQHDRHCTLFNGIDATDPNRLFSGQEWDQLSPNGHAYVMHERERLTGRAIHCGGRQPGRGVAVAVTKLVQVAELLVR
jgi:hypothetical protein